MNRSLTLLFFIFLFQSKIFGQSCPQNIDFENGGFANWTCYTGTVGVSGTTNVISVTNSGGPVAGRHTITTATSGNDPYGGFPQLCPNGGSYSLKLGNNLTADSAERVRYKIRIPAGANNFSILYSYAVVLDDGGNSHQSYQQPRFNVEAFDSATNTTVNCLPNPYVATASLPGFTLSNVHDPNGAQSVWYQVWTTRTLDLSGHAGKTIYIQFTTADCSLGAHFGYAYVDVQCGLFQITNGYCPGSSNVPLSAPPGYQIYSWRDSLWNVLGTGQNITITAPAQPKKIIVILTPYNGYGCVDTLSTYIYPIQPPVANFIRPDTFCAGSAAPFIDSSYSLSAGTFVNSWHWNFGDVGSGANDSSALKNPTHIFNTPGTYTVSLTVKSNLSCVSSAVNKTVVIVPKINSYAGSDTLICYNTKALLHGYPTPATPTQGSYSYAWSPSAGLSCATCKNTTTPNLTTTTTYYFTTNYYPTGCSQTDTIVVNVAPQAVSVTATASPTTVCPNGISQLNVSSAPTVCGAYAGGACTSSVTAVVGNNNGSNTAWYPFSSYYMDGRAQMLYKKSELNAVGITGGVITNLALNVSTKNSSIPFSGLTIKIGCTALTSLSTWQTGLTTVYSANYSTINGWNNFTLTTPYAWDGSSNLIVEMCYDNSAYSVNYDFVWSTTTAYNSTLFNCIDNSVGCNLLGVNITTNRPDIKFGMCLPSLAGLTYSWSPTTGLSNSSIMNPIATVASTTTYTVTASAGTCTNTTSSVLVNVNNVQANFIAVDTVCLGTTLNFTNTSTASATDTIKKYYWNFGDVGSGANNISHLKNPTHLFSSSGTFTVTLADTTVGGCTAIFTKSIVVIAPFTVDAGLNDSVCAGSSKNIIATVTPSTGTYTYSWTPTPTLSCSNCVSPSATPLVTTVYTVMVTGFMGCTAKDSVTIKVIPASPIPTVTASPLIVCPGGTAQLTASIPAATCGAASTSCSSGTNYVVGSGVSTVYYPFVGGYSDARTQLLFLKTELTTAGISAGVIRELAMYVGTKNSTIPYSNFTIKIGCTALTSLTAWQTGLTTVFTASSVSSFASTWNNFILSTPYSWDGNSNLLVEICFDNAVASGYDYVSYTSTAFNSLIVNYQNSGSGCNIVAAPIQFTNRPNVRFNTCSAATSVNYSWSPAASLSNANIYNPIATVNSTTTYTVSVANGNCPANTASVTISTSSLSVNAGRDTTICNGNSVHLNGTATGNNPNFTYSWSPSTGLSSSTIANPVATPTITTTYILTVTDNIFCSKKDTVVITVTPAIQVSFTATNISCNGGTNGAITANVLPIGSYTYSWNTAPIQTTASISNLSAGIYALTVSNGFCSITKNDTVTQPPVLANVVASMVSTVSCFGGSNGSAIAATPNGGTPNYTYSWNTSPVQTSTTATNLSAGTYTLTVTDSKGCSKTDTVQITQPPVLANVVASMVSTVSCFGGSNGSAIAATPNGGTPNYTYSWNTSPVQTSTTATNLSAGTYTLTVTDSKGCSKTDTVQITQPPVLANVVASMVSTVSCFGGSNGSAIAATPNGGTPNYTYSWNTSPVQTSTTATNLSAGTYTLTVTDSKGCSKTDTVQITQPPVLANVVASMVSTVSCFGGSNGSAIAATPNGGTPNYTYSWNTSPVQTSTTATNLSAGTYTLTVTDSKGCSKTDTVQITQPPVLANVVASMVSTVSCFGGSNGSAIAATPNGGTPNYTYSWNTSPVQISTTATNLSAGTYTLTVTDSKGCSKTDTVQITQPPVLANVVASMVSTVSCFGGSNGSAIAATPNGGTPNYTYSWNTSPVQTSTTATNLSAGTYTLTVTDSKGCSKTDTVQITQPPVLANVVASMVSTVSCFGGSNGSAIAATPNGGTPNYTYSWNTSPVQTSTTATNLSAGTYTLTVTDSKGCSKTDTVQITQPPVLANVVASMVSTVSCFGGSNGSAIAATPNGGTPNYTYSWNTSPVQTSTTATNLSAGTYTLTVTDSKGCSKTDTVQITQPNNITTIIAYMTSPVSCNGGNNGAAQCTTPTGGVAPYSYSWNTSPIQTTQTATGLSSGTYTVTVTDANNCFSLTDTVQIIQPQPLSNVVASMVSPVSCFGGNNGSAHCTTPTGGTIPYSYSWNTLPIQTTQTATGLSFGTYTVTVTDAHNCPALTDTVLITQPPILSNVVASMLSPVSCFGGSNGSAVATTPTGGTPNYSYSWNTTPVQTSTTATNLSTGTYTLTVTDAKGCSKTDTVQITQPPVLSNVLASMTSAVSCHGYNDGSAIAATPNGGTPNYSYSWNTSPVQTSTTATNLSAGTYTLTITDANGCLKTDTVQITQPTILSNVVASMISSVLCNSGANGSAQCTTPIGGTIPYNYSWNTSPIQTTQTATGLSFGIYTVTVTDAHNCPALTDTVLITQPQPLSNVVAAMVSSVSCFGGNNGSAHCTTPIGGTAPYSYSWNTLPIQITQTATGLSYGTYTVTVTDAHNCPALIDTVLITQPPILSNVLASMTSAVSCHGYNDGSAIAATPNGGTPNYSYSWNTSPVQTSTTATNLSAGTYTLTITDANGCLKTDTVQITQPPVLANIIASMSTAVSCHGFNDGSAIAASPSGGTPNYSYSWNTSPVQTSTTATNLSAGTYTLTVTDSKGCSKTDTVQITQPTVIQPITATVITNVFCNGGHNGSINTSTPTGGTPPYTYSWNTTPIQTTALAVNLSVGTYTVTVTDANDCPTVSATASITQPPALTGISAFTIKNLVCNSGNDGVVSCTTPTGGTAPYSYSWNSTPIQITQTANNLPAGTYIVTVTDAHQCAYFTASTTVTAPSGPTNSLIAVVLKNVSCYGDSDAQATVLKPTYGQPPFVYTWNTTPIQQTQTANNLPADSFKITVTDSLGCVQYANAIITQPTPLHSSIAIKQNVSCFGGNNGYINLNGTYGGTPPYTYAWNTVPIKHSTTATFLSAGKYIVQVVDMNQCTTTDTAIITQPSPISIGTINIVNNPCSAVNAGSAKVLQASGGTRPFTFIWNTTPQQVDSVATNLSAGNYSVTIIDANGCTYSQSATINTDPSVLAIAYTDTTINLGENFTLNSYNSIGTNASTTYQWYNSANSLIGNATTLNVSPTENEYFILRIFNDSICPSTDTVFMKIAKCGVIILPNAFSPNDDGLDDVFKIINPEDIENITRFDIFDRWGKTMFSTNNKYEGWDGKVGGKNQPLETYVYYLHAKCFGGKEINLKGDITLIR